MGIPRGHCRLACLSTMPMELMPAHRKGFLETLVHGILQQLQRSQKWRTPQTDLQPGNIVVVREDAWPLARITETFPGQDGRARVARLKTSDSVFKRLIKLALILCDDAPSPSTVKDHGPVWGGGGGGGVERVCWSIISTN